MADVWDDSVAPGGYVCDRCGMPTESEPCATHGALPGHQHYPGDGGCSGTDCRKRWEAVTTHTRSQTDAGPDYCAECSEAIQEWVAWPCPRMSTTPGLPTPAEPFDTVAECLDIAAEGAARARGEGA